MERLLKGREQGEGRGMVECEIEEVRERVVGKRIDVGGGDGFDEGVEKVKGRVVWVVLGVEIVCKGS